ncbi:MAG: gliding motility-associated C-terminal domain-containing protein [Flavobacteriales bacterium]
MLIRTVLRSFTPLVVLLFGGPLLAQVPTKCLEIESILVDACNPSDLCSGSSEGQNEMVRFRVGPAPIALNDLEADWPNNPWRGLIQNGTTAQLTTALNATVGSCGRLLEPPGGILPAGAQVLMVTSTEMCVAANPFTGLADTLYIVFQAPGNTQGHFANNPAVGGPESPDAPTGNSVRTLVLSHTASNCSDTASYVRELLVNVNGLYAGVSALNDGATTRFSWPGVPQVTYVNLGCQAPIEPVTVEAEALGELCGGSPVTLQGTVQGTVISVAWTGGAGTFSDPTALTTTYTPAPGETGTVVLQLCVETDCAVPVCSTVELAAGAGPVLSIGPDAPAVCAGAAVDLVASGADSYVWNTGATGPVLSVTEPGTYSVQGSNACGSESVSIDVTAGVLPQVSITGPNSFCEGTTITLQAAGTGPFAWNTGATTDQLIVTAPGSYTVSATNSCGTATANLVVTQQPLPEVSVTGTTAICAGASTTLSATGATSYVWSTGTTTASITVSQPGTFSVVGSNACGTDEASVIVSLLPAPLLVLSGEAVICPGESTVLTASSNTTVTWNIGTTGPTLTVSTPGTYTATATNSCGSISDAVVVEQTDLGSGITASVSSGFAPLSVQFGQDGPAGTWDFGDGAEAIGTSVGHVFTQPGTYVVSLVITADGCTFTDEVVITVLLPGTVINEEVSFIEMPNVVTPNGDAFNELWAPIAQRIVRLEIFIYNRWGQLVGTIDRPGQSWDMRGPSGELVADGTYFYTLNAWGGDGVDHVKNGSFTVLR